MNNTEASQYCVFFMYTGQLRGLIVVSDHPMLPSLCLVLPRGAGWDAARTCLLARSEFSLARAAVGLDSACILSIHNANHSPTLLCCCWWSQSPDKFRSGSTLKDNDKIVVQYNGDNGSCPSFPLHSFPLSLAMVCAVMAVAFTACFLAAVRLDPDASSLLRTGSSLAVLKLRSAIVFPASRACVCAGHIEFAVHGKDGGRSHYVGPVETFLKGRPVRPFASLGAPSLLRFHSLPLSASGLSSLGKRVVCWPRDVLLCDVCCCSRVRCVRTNCTELCVVFASPAGNSGMTVGIDEHKPI